MNRNMDGAANSGGFNLEQLTSLLNASSQGDPSSLAAVLSGGGSTNNNANLNMVGQNIFANPQWQSLLGPLLAQQLGAAQQQQNQQHHQQQNQQHQQQQHQQQQHQSSSSSMSNHSNMQSQSSQFQSSGGMGKKRGRKPKSYLLQQQLMQQHHIQNHLQNQQQLQNMQQQQLHNQQQQQAEFRRLSEQIAMASGSSPPSGRPSMRGPPSSSRGDQSGTMSRFTLGGGSNNLSLLEQQQSRGASASGGSDAQVISGSSGLDLSACRVNKKRRIDGSPNSRPMGMSSHAHNFSQASNKQQAPNQMEKMQKFDSQLLRLAKLQSLEDQRRRVELKRRQEEDRERQRQQQRSGMDTATTSASSGGAFNLEQLTQLFSQQSDPASVAASLQPATMAASSLTGDNMSANLFRQNFMGNPKLRNMLVKQMSDAYSTAMQQQQQQQQQQHQQQQQQQQQQSSSGQAQNLHSLMNSIAGQQLAKKRGRKPKSYLLQQQVAHQQQQQQSQLQNQQQQHQAEFRRLNEQMIAASSGRLPVGGRSTNQQQPQSRYSSTASSLNTSLLDQSNAASSARTSSGSEIAGSSGLDCRLGLTKKRVIDNSTEIDPQRRATLVAQQQAAIAAAAEALRKNYSSSNISNNAAQSSSVNNAQSAKSSQANQMVKMQKFDTQILKLAKLQSIEDQRRRAEQKSRQDAERELVAQKEREREREQQQKAALAELDRERRRQHMIMIRNLEAYKRNEEREKTVSALMEERKVQMEQKETRKRLEFEFLKEIRKPVDDMLLKNQKPLATLNRIPGLKLPGKAFADLLMFYEFMHNFGETIGIEVKKLPSLNTLQMALLGLDEEAEDKLYNLMMIMLQYAISSQRFPLNQNAFEHENAQSTAAGVSEVLEFYLRGITTSPSDYACDLLRVIAKKNFDSLSPTQKTDMMAFLCNELLSESTLAKQMEDTMENVANLRKNKWVLENDLRKWRTLKARRDLRAEEAERSKAEAEALKQQQDNSSQDNNNDEATTTNTTDDNDSQSDDKTTARSGRGPKVAADSDLEAGEPIPAKNSDKVDKTERADDEDNEISNEELDKKIERLNRQYNQTSNKLYKALNSMRASPLGQDRYRRRYWVLPQVGGVFVESMESTEPEEIKNNEYTEEELEAAAAAKRAADEEASAALVIENATAAKAPAAASAVAKPPPPVVVKPIVEIDTISRKAPSLRPLKTRRDHREEAERIRAAAAMASDPDATDENDSQDKTMNESDISMSVKEDTEISNGKQQDDEPEEEKGDEKIKIEPCDGEIVPESEIKMDINNVDIIDKKSVASEEEIKGVIKEEDKKEEIINDHIENQNENQNIDLKVQKIPWFSILPISPCLRLKDDEPWSEDLISELAEDEALKNEEKFCESLSKKLGTEQYEVPVKIHPEFQRGWWRITDPQQLRSILLAMHERGSRERVLQKHLEKYFNYACQSCKNTTVDFDIIPQDRQLAEQNFGAPPADSDSELSDDWPVKEHSATTVLDDEEDINKADGEDGPENSSEIVEPVPAVKTPAKKSKRKKPGSNSARSRRLRAKAAARRKLENAKAQS